MRSAPSWASTCCGRRKGILLYGPSRMWIDVGTPPNTATYERLVQLPERARAALDIGSAPGHPPPSADVWYVVQVLLGLRDTAVPVVTLALPSTLHPLTVQTTLLSRGAQRKEPALTGTVGRSTTPIPLRTPSEKEPDTRLPEAIVHAFGIPTPSPHGQGTSVRTSAMLSAAQETQAAYTHARSALESLLPTP